MKLAAQLTCALHAPAQISECAYVEVAEVRRRMGERPEDYTQWFREELASLEYLEAGGQQPASSTRRGTSGLAAAIVGWRRGIAAAAALLVLLGAMALRPGRGRPAAAS